MSARCDPSRTSHTTNAAQTQSKMREGNEGNHGNREEKNTSEANVPKDLRFSMDINSDVPGCLVGKRKVGMDEVDEPAAKGDGLLRCLDFKK